MSKTSPPVEILMNLLPHMTSAHLPTCVHIEYFLHIFHQDLYHQNVVINYFYYCVSPSVDLLHYAYQIIPLVDQQRWSVMHPIWTLLSVLIMMLRLELLVYLGP